MVSIQNDDPKPAEPSQLDLYIIDVKRRGRQFNFVKKCYVDSAAVYFYNLGISVLHFSLFAASWFVENADYDQALFLESKQLAMISQGQLSIDKEFLTLCSDIAQRQNQLMTTIKVTHFVLMLLCLEREIKEASVTTFGKIMLFLQAAGSMWQIGILILLVDAWFDNNKMSSPHQKDYPPCASDPKMRNLWVGNVQPWFLLEITLASSFVSTMLLLLIKSRFTSIGTEQTDKFDPLYMSLMINKIAESIEFDLDQDHRTFDQTKKFYVNQRRKLRVENTTIKIQITEAGWEEIFMSKVLNEKFLILPENAPRWIK